MDRRGFLQRLGAAAAAFTAARAGVSAAVESKPAAAIRTTTPRVAVTVDTSRFETELERTERMLRGYIKKCHVVSSEIIGSVGDAMRVRAVYRTSDEPGPLDAQVAEMTKNGRIVECSVSMAASESSLLNVWMLGSPAEKFTIEEPQYEIDVTWIVPSL